jgi:hypothetical protein
MEFHPKKKRKSSLILSIMNENKDKMKNKYINKKIKF